MLPLRRIRCVVLLAGIALGGAPGWTRSAEDAEAIYEAGHPGLQPPVRLPESRGPVPLPEGATSRPGRMIVRVLVNRNGSVTAVEVLRVPYGAGELRPVAEKAVRGWRYDAARLEGEPVACWLTESVEFTASAPFAPAPERPESRPAAGEAARTPAASPVAEPSAERGRGTGPDAAPPAAPGAAPGDGIAPAAESGGDHAAAGAVPERIDAAAGGPGRLVLGASRADVEAALEGAVRTDGPEGKVLLRADAAGIEATLGPDGAVVALRYVFRDGLDGLAASSLRTRKGLGEGSFCLGITPAYGRPAGRVEDETPEGLARTVVRYERPEGRFEFTCLEGRLAQLVVAVR